MIVVLLSGALGSGKTTLLLSLAAMTSRAGKRTAILENDVGTVPVDAPVLRGRGFAVEEIRAGCICCNLQTQLPTAMNKLRSKFEPEVLFIEPSGVAAPGILLSSLNGILMPTDRIAVIYLVDMVKYVESGGCLSPFLLMSAQTADLILGTKTPLVPEDSLNRLKKELSDSGCVTPSAPSEVTKTWEWKQLEDLASRIHKRRGGRLNASTPPEPMPLTMHACSYRLCWRSHVDGSKALLVLRQIVDRVRRRVVDTGGLKLGTVKIAVSEGHGTIIAVSDALSPVVEKSGAVWETPPDSITLNILAYGQGIVQELINSILNDTDELKEWKASHEFRRNEGEMVQARLRL